MTTIRRVFIFLVVIAVSTLRGQIGADLPDNRGTVFYVAFPQNMSNPAGAFPRLTLLIAADGPTKVELSAPGYAPALIDIPAMTIPSHTAESLPIDVAFQLPPNVTSTGGIRVRSVGRLNPAEEGAPIAVWVASRRPTSGGIYMAMPVDVLGTEYRVMARPGISPAALGSQVTVLSTEDDTSVTITTPVDVPGVTLPDGEGGFRVELLLDQFQTFLLQLDEGDLTGTLVSASNPVVVLGGNKFGSVVGDTDISTPDSGSPDFMVEQMPPTFTWGDEFVIAPIVPRTAGDVIRILAHESDTQVSVNGSFQTTLAAGAIFEFVGPSTGGTWITTTKPVLVAQFNKGQGAEIAGKPVVFTDPFMVLAVPLKQLSRDYRIRTVGAVAPPIPPYTHRVNIVAEDGQRLGVRLDTSAPPITQNWTQVPGSGYSVTTVTIMPSARRIWHDSADVMFGLSVYGQVSADGYGYVAGQLFLDQTDPVVSVPDSLTVEATGPDGASVTWDDPTATDFGRGEIDVTCTAEPNSVFGLGTQIVECTATDAAGNTTTESFNVTVEDTTPPMFPPVLEDIEVNATSASGAVVTYDEPKASDVVDISVEVVCSPPSGSTFALGEHIVTCTATDDFNNSTEGTFMVTVTNSPPVCTATPSTPLLWPPNHQLVSVAINGVTDPDGDSVTIRIDSIFQDEPANDTGDGNTAVDGFGVGTSVAQVRAERSGGGNGRVYHIRYTAADSIGAICSGEVTVGVPHDQGKKGAPVDEGALYDSTGL